jgi:hypothetical protein
MHLEQTGANELTITGNIKSIEDSLKIKAEINNILKTDGSRIKLVIKDSFSMTSTVIGFLMKLVHHDKIQISTSVGDSRLYDLLDELNLVQLLNVFQRS